MHRVMSQHLGEAEAILLVGTDGFEPPTSTL